MWKRVSWNLLVWVLAGLAAWAARKGATYVWSKVSDSDEPGKAADGSRTIVEVISWAAIAGVSAAVARWLAQRGAATAWRSVMGEEPPTS